MRCGRGARPAATARGTSPSRHRASSSVDLYLTADAQDGRTRDLAGAKPLERLVGLVEGMLLDPGADRDLRRELEKLLAVAASQVRHRSNHSLAPEDLVREARDVAHVDPGADDDAALCRRPQRQRYVVADRR